MLMPIWPRLLKAPVNDCWGENIKKVPRVEESPESACIRSSVPVLLMVRFPGCSSHKRHSSYAHREICMRGG